jgi:hypothetical protein
MDLDAKLLDEVRERRDEARHRVLAARLELDNAEAEYHELDNALNTFEGVRREHEDFTRDALSQ